MTTLKGGRAPDPVVEPPSYGRLRRLLFGPPLPNHRETSERLSNPVALAVLSSDALSSVAYATEEMVKVLIPVVGLAAFRLSMPIAGAITLLLVLLVMSYRETIKAYPNAGGAYIVTRDNFGVVPAQAAGVALLIDYIMTVAVSVAAAVAALYSYFPALFAWRVGIAAAFIWVIAWGNLRGVRAAGRIFAAPTYFFLAMVGCLLVAGASAALRGNLHPLPPPPDIKTVPVTVTALILLHAYASGTTALTGVEAISNGVTVFRAVEWRNARRVLVWMGAILATAFLGITALAWRIHPVPTEKKTLVSELGAVVFGSSLLGRFGLLLLQIATTAILVLAANTSFADFPRLASFHAGDGYLPRPLRRRGARLVYSVGIVTLATIATVVEVVLGADVHRMIPLYAVGVFFSFTFSQTGMIRRHLRLRESGWLRGLVVNALGALGSALASVAILISKFLHGAWVVALLVPGGVRAFLSIHEHYKRIDAWLADPGTGRSDWRAVRAVVCLPAGNPLLEQAARLYAERLRPAESIEVRPVSTLRQRRIALRAVRRGAPGDALSLLVLPHPRGQTRRPDWTPCPGLARRARRDRDVAVATLVTDRDGSGTRPARHICLVAVEDADARARRALGLAQLLGPDEVRAICVDLDGETTQRTVEQWQTRGFDVPLNVVPAPYRERGGPLRTEVQRHFGEGPGTVVSVVVCTLGPRWWQRPLYLADTAHIRAALAGLPGTAVIDHRLPLPRRSGQGRRRGLGAGAPSRPSDVKNTDEVRKPPARVLSGLSQRRDRPAKSTSAN